MPPIRPTHYSPMPLTRLPGNSLPGIFIHLFTNCRRAVIKRLCRRRANNIIILWLFGSGRVGAGAAAAMNSDRPVRDAVHERAVAGEFAKLILQVDLEKRPCQSLLRASVGRFAALHCRTAAISGALNTVLNWLSVIIDCLSGERMPVDYIARGLCEALSNVPPTCVPGAGALAAEAAAASATFSANRKPVRPCSAHTLGSPQIPQMAQTQQNGYRSWRLGDLDHRQLRTIAVRRV